MARKREFKLNEREQGELKQAYAATKDGELRKRLQAVRLYGSGYTVAAVQEITGCSRRSLTTWCGAYRREGVAGLIDRRVGGNRARLTAGEMAEVKERVHQYRPIDLLGAAGVATADGQHWTVADLKQALRSWYQVEYKQNKSYHELFAHCGFSYQRPAKVYRSRREERVAAFGEALEKNCST